MKYLTRDKRTIVSVIIIILSLVFGIRQELLEDIVAIVDTPKVGYSRVISVIDGDTIEVASGDSREKIRFIGLDTPETHHPDKAVQCYGQAATDYLTKLIGTQDVRLENDPTNTNRDRYNRLLRYVYLEDGTLVNQEMVAKGYGFAYVSFPFEKKADFVASQDHARDNNLGLWASCEIEVDGNYTNTAPAEAE